MRRATFLKVGVLLFGSLLGSFAAADDYPPDVQRKIQAVEKGLIPAVRIKGRTSPSTIGERMERDHVPGVSVAVIDNYQVVWAKGYGLADAEADKPVTSDTLFQAASMSKPVTAMAALKLVEQGVLDLDRDVNEQLKSWQVPANDFTRQHAVDLRGLLSHTAGLTVHGFPGYTVDAALPSVPQILDGLPPANSPAVRVNKVPGNGFRYSGGGTTVVQLLLTDVTGRPFPDLMRDSVLARLAMTASTFEQPLPEDRRSQAATAHNAEGKPVAGRWHVYPEMAPAGLWTTPTDMARYAIEIQLAHEGKSRKVLSRDMVDKMLTPQGGGQVGLGPFLTGNGRARRFMHGGGNQGFICQFVAFVDGGKGAVVMTNSDVGSRAVNELINSISQAYDWPDFLPAEREAAQVDEKILDRVVGDYALGVSAGLSIRRRDDRLFIKLMQQPEMEIHPQPDATFFTEDPDVTGNYIVDEQGQVVAIALNFGDREVRAKRVK